MNRILIIGGECDSLINFRGELIKKFKEKNCEVFAISGGKCSDSTLESLSLLGVDYQNISFHRSGINPFSDISYLLKLIIAIYRINPDILFAYTIKPVIFGLIASRYSKTKKSYALITGLGSAFIHPNSFVKKIVSYIAKFLYKFSLKNASLVFFQNHDDLNFFKIGNIIGKSKKTVVLDGSGVNLNHFSYEKPSNDLNFLFVGRLIKDKGIIEYIHAAEAIISKYKNLMIKFSVVGSIDINPTSVKSDLLEDYISRGVIKYYQHTDDIRIHLKECSIFVLPSYREGIPRSSLEAMATGRAIITSNAPGCKETVIDNKNGFLVKVGSVDELVLAVEKFIHNRELIESMGVESRAYVEKRFDVEKVNKDILENMGLKSA